MDKKEIEALVDKKLTEAKLKLAEQRINFILTLGGGFIAVLGILYPLYLSKQNTDKVDSAIRDMRAQFKELAGNQLNKPVLECTIEGKSIEGQTLNYSAKRTKYIIEFTNVGDAPARYIRMLLYLNSEQDIYFFAEFGDAEKLSFCDEPSYRHVHSIIPFFNAIDPKSSKQFPLYIYPDEKGQNESLVLLKVFYSDQPEPTRYQFKIVLNQK